MEADVLGASWTARRAARGPIRGVLNSNQEGGSVPYQGYQVVGPGDLFIEGIRPLISALSGERSHIPRDVLEVIDSPDGLGATPLQRLVDYHPR